MTQALKFDNEKPGMDLLPVAAKRAIAEVFDFGAKKYARHNWRSGFNYSRLIAAAERHLDAFNDGEDLDPESGKSHLAHLGCCVLMLLESTIKGYGTDDRFKPVNWSSDPIDVLNDMFNHPLHYPENNLESVFGTKLGPSEPITQTMQPTIAVGAWKPSENSTSDHKVIAEQLGGLNESAKKIESW